MGTFISARRPSYWLGSLLFILSLAPAARAQHVGYVFELGGEWLLGHGSPRRLSRGHKLPAGGTVYVQSPSSRDHIVILDNNGEIIARRRCSVAEDCNRPIVLPKAGKARPSSVGVVFSSVMKLLWGEPERYIPLRSRGLELTEGVARLNKGEVDLSPVLKRMAAGDYHLRMREVMRGDKTADGQWLGPFALKWEPPGPAALPVAGLRPGLYEVASLDYSGGMYMPKGESAWVLVGEAGTFEKASAAHEEALALTGKWGDAVTPAAARGFVRAHLSHLSRQAAK
jgi:hypothetical protein